MNIFGYTAVVWKESEGYVSKCPELGVASCGDSFEDAVTNLREGECLRAKEKYTAHFEASIP